MQLEKQLIPFRYILHQVGNAAVEDLRDDFKKGPAPVPWGTPPLSVHSCRQAASKFALTAVAALNSAS